MNKLLMIAALLLGAANAHALSRVSGAETCARLSTNYSTIACMEVISGQYVDTLASGVCNNLTTNSSTIECMQSIVGHWYNDNALVACNNLTTNSSTVSCLQVIADKGYTPEEASICNSLSTNSATIDCLARLGTPGGRPAPAPKPAPKPAPGAPISSSPYGWTYYDGQDRVVNAGDGFIQLSEGKNYCNGRVKLTRTSYTTFNLRIEGSWCKAVRFGFDKQGSRLVQNSAVTTIRLDYSNGSDGRWVGYGKDIQLSIADLLLYSNNAFYVNNQISFVLMTDSRDDSHTPAYEKLSVNLNL